MAGGECSAPLVVALLMSLLPRSSLSLGLALRAEAEDNLPALSQAILQLTQKFSTLEGSLESRLSRLTDSAAKGEALISSVSSRLDKVDALVEKVEALDARLTLETSSLRSIIAATNRDLQDTSTRLERMDRMAETAMRLVEEEVEEERGARHGTRSSLDFSDSDLASLSATITRSVVQEVERTFQNSLYKRLSKNVAQLKGEVQEAREELEHLGTRGEKTTQDAVVDIKNKIHSVHRDLALKISSTPSLDALEPVLHLVNSSVVESIARAAAGLNLTLLDEAARRRETSYGEAEEHRGSHSTDEPAPHCPDPTTVTTLLEVKYLLQSLLRKSEDLRHGLTKQTREGVDLLKLLHQRFSVLMRRMNDPDLDQDYTQMLASEIQNLSNLVETKYMAVMMAQTAFIDSCKRIQEEEPLLERKVTELLDKLVTNIDLGYQHNRQQLSELKEVVTQLGQREANTNATQEPARTRTESALRDAANVPGLVQDVLLEAVEAANHTMARLEEVEGSVDDVAADLLSLEWTERRHKDAADQLLTAAKDLKGYSQEQIFQSLDLYSELMAVMELFNASVTVSLSHGQAATHLHTPPLELLGDAAPLTLPPTCTAALLQQVRDLQRSQTSAKTSASYQPVADAPSGHQGQQGQGEARDDQGEEAEEEDVPAWYTDPVFLSGNYGTPDRGLPVFREEDWVDMDDVYDMEPVPADTPAPAPALITTTTTTPSPATPPPAQPRPATGSVNRYFGVT